MLICVCRRIDSDDFASEAELRARILDEDFQCGLCQMQYLIAAEDSISSSCSSREEIDAEGSQYHRINPKQSHRT